MDALPGDLPPTRVPRQPACRYCDPHEDHGRFRCGADLDGAACPCPGHEPPGVYEEAS